MNISVKIYTFILLSNHFSSIADKYYFRLRYYMVTNFAFFGIDCPVR